MPFRRGLACTQSQARAVLFAAGLFTGIINCSGMREAVAEASVGHVSETLGPRIPLLLEPISMPPGTMFHPNSFHFDVRPVIAQVAGHCDVRPVEVARAAPLG